MFYACHGLVNIFDSSLYDNTCTHGNDMMNLHSDINMNNHKIRNLQKPVDAKNAVRKLDLLNLYVNIPIKKENTFKYLMDNNEGIAEQNITIHGINNYNNSIHFYNKKAYSVTVTRTPGSNNYDSIISFNTLSLDDNGYSLIIEWFHPEKFNRFVNVTGSNINILEQFNHEFQQYIRTLVQFTKNNNNILNGLRINLKGTTLGSDLNGYLILYGVKGLYDNVTVNVYDDHYTMLENSLKYNTNINMNNNRIFNTGDPVNDKDVVNKMFISRNFGLSNLYGQFYSDRHLVSNDTSVHF